MLKKTVTWIGCLVAMTLAAPAHAGGVIIDGWDDGGNPTTMSCGQACSARLNNDQEDDDSGQEIYLLAAWIFNGHAAAASADNLSDEDLNSKDAGDDTEIGVDGPDTPLPTPILVEIEEFDAEMGGCAAAPGGALAALAGLLLLRRRRR